MRMIKQSMGTLGGILIVFALAACSDGLAPELAQDTTPQFGNGNGGGRGGGPGDDGDSGPSAGKVITTFANQSGDFGILGDGSAYTTIKKKAEVTSEIRSGGQYWLEVNPGPGARELCVAFPDAGPDAVFLDPMGEEGQDWVDFVAATSGVGLGETYCGKATLHTGHHSVAEQFLGMDTDPTTSQVLDIQTSGGKMVLEDLLEPQSWEWRLMFDDGRTGTGIDQNGGIDRKLGLCILYNADGTWTVGTGPTIAQDSMDDETACDYVDEYVNLIRVTGGEEGAVFTHVVRFRMPFSYTVTPQ